MRERRAALPPFVVLALLAAAIPSARAESGLPASSLEGVPEVPSGGALRVTVALLVTLAAILLFATLLKRFRIAGGAAPGGLQLENRLALSRGGQVVVVRVDGRRILLGITATQVNLIAELHEHGETPEERGAFERLLTGVLGRGEKA